MRTEEEVRDLRASILRCVDHMQSETARGLLLVQTEMLDWVLGSDVDDLGKVRPCPACGTEARVPKRVDLSDERTHLGST